MNDERSDEAIASLVQMGDAESFGILIDRYQARLTRYGHRFFRDSDQVAELVQDSFIKAYTNIQSFDTNRRFSPWIYRIAHNECMNLLRRDRFVTYFDLGFDTVFPHLIAAETSDAESIARELSTELEQYLDRLDPKYREPIILYFYEGLSYQDISDVLHIPVTTVGVRIKRGKDQLRVHYQNES